MLNLKGFIKRKNMQADIKKKVNKVLSKRMGRKDFLKYTATAGLMAIGGGMIIQAITGLDSLGSKKASKSSTGYGKSSYGG